MYSYLFVIIIMCMFFFFSSRRRHTRWTGDWSSDVCSSDLVDWVLARAENLPFRDDSFGSASISLALRNVSSAQLTFREMSRSEERRVGKEGRSRWGQFYCKQI